MLEDYSDSIVKLLSNFSK
ncbi:hypothetical protein B4U79_00259, partial [Dinothrombium tinctorium]